MVTIQLLGGFKLAHEGESIPALTRPRAKSLLAYLLLHHATPQDRAHLAYTFWPETNDRQARTNLRRELHQLRQTSPLFATLIHNNGQTIQWQMRPADRLDVTEFTRLLVDAERETDEATRKTQYQAAIDLYHGDLLPGLYEDWVLAKREALRQAFIRALETLTTLLVADREYTTATHMAQRLLQYDPLYEAGYRQLMELYALQNDRARALHAYHSCATVLERELGVPPGAEIEELYQRLQYSEPQGRAVQKVNPITAFHLVGRKVEWQTLLSTWRQAAQGRAHTILIEGEAGIGKTRLAEELFEWVNRQGIPTARTRSYAAEGALAYAPVIEWLRSPLLHKAAALLEPVWRTELARLLPEILTEFPDLPRPEPLTERWQRQRLFEALARAVTVDTRPKLLLIDDLQWCDQETLEWLRFLLRFAAHLPLLVVGTVRTGEVTAEHPFHALSRELRGNDQLITIALHVLTISETANLAGQITNEPLDETDAQRLFAASQGNPLFAVEMVRAGFFADTPIDAQSSTTHSSTSSPVTFPPKVYAVIQHRLAQLSPVARPLADLAAVMGRGFTYIELVAASNGSEETIVNGLDELWQRKIIHQQGANAYDFSHDRIREATYAALSPMRRKLLHQRIVDMLMMVYSTETDRVSGELAFHCEQAGLIEEAVAWYQRAAQVAWDLNAFRDAADHLHAALEVLAGMVATRDTMALELRLQIQFAAFMVAATGFTHPARQAALVRAQELAVTLKDIDKLALVLDNLAGMHITSGDIKQVTEASKQADAIVDQLESIQGKASIYHLYASVARYRGDSIRATAMYTACLKLDEMAYQQTNAPSSYNNYIKTRLLMAVSLWINGYPEQAINLAQSCRAQRDTVTALNDSTTMMFQAALLWRNRGDDIILTEEAEQMLNLGTNYEIALARQSGSVFSGWLLAKQGQLSEGIALTHQGIDGFRRMSHVMYQTHRLAMLVEMLLWAAEHEQAGEILQEAFDVSEHRGERFWDVELHRLQGDLLLAQGEPDEQAEAAYGRAIEVSRQQGAKSLELRATMALSRLWQRQGRTNEAYQSLTELYGWFTEGFDTQDLRSAQALLHNLSG